MLGVRLDDGLAWTPETPAGGYWKNGGGTWMAITPNGLVADLRRHTVVEHDDQTITVSPSILVRGGASGEWHGYLERGAWREC